MPTRPRARIAAVALPKDVRQVALSIATQQGQEVVVTEDLQEFAARTPDPQSVDLIIYSASCWERCSHSCVSYTPWHRVPRLIVSRFERPSPAVGNDCYWATYLDEPITTAALQEAMALALWLPDLIYRHFESIPIAADGASDNREATDDAAVTEHVGERRSPAPGMNVYRRIHPAKAFSLPVLSIAHQADTPHHVRSHTSSYPATTRKGDRP